MAFNWWLDLALRPNSSYTCSMAFMIGDKADQGKTLTLFWAWYCVVIYALCEAGKYQVPFLHEMNNDILCMNTVKAYK